MDNIDCIVPGLEHSMQLAIVAHGYQCFICDYCGHIEDVIEDGIL